MVSSDFQRRVAALCMVSAVALPAACGRQNDDANAAQTDENTTIEMGAEMGAETGATDAGAAPETAAPPANGAGDSDNAPTEADAAAFVEDVETFYREFGEYAARIAWANQTHINYDTNWLNAKASAEGAEMGVKFANEAKRFNDVALPDDMRRKLALIKLGLNIPAPERPGAAQALSEINTRMGATYATGKIELDGVETARVDLEAMMGEIRDPAKLQEIWVKWREIPVAETDAGTTMKEDYAAMTALANEGARDVAGALRPAAGRLRRGNRPPVGSGQTALRPAPLPCARGTERGIWRRDRSPRRADPRRHSRQYVGAKLGRHLRPRRAAGRRPRLRRDRTVESQRL